MSTASLKLPSGSARSTCAGIPPAAPDDLPAAGAADGGKPAEFDDLLQADEGKARANGSAHANARPGTAGKRNRGEIEVAPDSPFAPAPVATDLASLLALLGAPAVPPDATPLSLPEFDGGLPAGLTADVTGETIFSNEDGGVVLNPPTPAPAPFAGAALPTNLSAAPIPTFESPASTAALSALPAEKTNSKIPLAENTPAADAIEEAMDLVAIPVPPSETPRNPASTRADRGGKSLSAAWTGANIAAVPSESAPLEKSEVKTAPGNFLVPKEETVTELNEGLGIDVAKPSVTMASARSSHPHTAFADVSALSAAPQISAEAAAPSATTAQFETKTVAQGAVDAVLAAVDRVSAERSSVTLQFSLGGNDLAVRVDFRGGAVQATFRTDSPELRAALAHEWSAAGSKMTDASVRMAPPVFTSSDAGTSTSFSGASAQQQQQQAPHRESSSRSSGEGFSLNAFRPVGGNTSAGSRVPSVAARQDVSTALHLHTFA